MKTINSKILLLFLIICVLAFGIVASPTKSLWVDEAYTVNTARNWFFMWNSLFHFEGNMWLYYTIIHFWLKIGETELIVRLPSIIFSGATIPVIYLLGKKLFGESTGRLAAILLSVNMFFIAYSQETRSYSLFLLLSAVSSYFFILSLEKRTKNEYWTGYIVSSILTIYSHLFGLLVIFSQFASLIFIRKKIISWKRFIFSGIIIFLATIPILLAPSFRSGQISWIQSFDYKNVFALTLALSGDNPVLVLLFFLLFVWLFYYLLKLKKNKIDLWPYIFLFVLLILPPLLAFLYSIAIKPIVTSKYLISCLIPFIILISVGITNIRSVKLSRILILFIILLSGIRLGAWYSGNASLQWVIHNNKDDWRGITSYIALNSNPKDIVIFYPYYLEIPFNYYWKEHINKNPAVVNVSSDPNFNGTGSRLPEPNLSLVNSFSKNHGRIWFIVDDSQIKERNLQKLSIQNILESNYHLKRVFPFGQMSVILYFI